MKELYEILSRTWWCRFYNTLYTLYTLYCLHHVRREEYGEDIAYGFIVTLTFKKIVVLSIKGH